MTLLEFFCFGPTKKRKTMTMADIILVFMLIVAGFYFWGYFAGPPND